jgi:hypothetical protein
MIKASELRIGNFVIWNSDDHTEHAKIAMIAREEVAFSCGDAGLINEIEGIPLTNEWLTKLAFRRKEKFEFYLELLAIEDSVVNGWVVCQFDQVDGKGHILQNLSIRYVHQLQNLFFALTGKELILQTNKNNIRT